MKDNRSCPRKETAVWIETFDGKAPLVAQDVSLGGMMVATNQHRWPGELIRMRIKLPKEKRAFRVTARVVDLVEVPHGVGLSLRFLKLAPEAQLMIHNFVDDRPLPNFDEGDPLGQVQSWVTRIIEDCKQLKLLARST